MFWQNGQWKLIGRRNKLRTAGSMCVEHARASCRATADAATALPRRSHKN